MVDPLRFPKPTIYLRNRLRLKGDVFKQDVEPPLADVFNTNTFLKGKEQLIRRTIDDEPKHGYWRLIAAGGERPLQLHDRLVEPTTNLLQIWELESWGTLAGSIYEYSEASWYRAMGATLADEEQELLVNLTSGTSLQHRPLWNDLTDEPDHLYLYEEATTPLGKGQAYLYDQNWLSSLMETQFGSRCVWCAGQITARPAVICTLWAIPARVDVVQELAKIARSRDTRARYARLMNGAAEVTRQVLYPIYTERLDELVADEAAEPIVPAP